MQEQEHFKLKAAKQEKENTELKQLIIEKEMSNQEIKNEMFITRQNLLISKRTLLNEKKNILSDLNKQKIPLDQMLIQRMNLFKFSIALVVILYYVITFYLIYKLGWNIMEPWTYIINTAIPIVGLALYFTFQEKELNPNNIYKAIKNKIRVKIYSKFGFDNKKVEILIKDINNLENEIKKEEQALNVHV